MQRRPYVAVVDDDVGMCRALMRLLHASDMEVATFHQGRDLLRAMSRREPDCVVLDIELSDFKGLDLFDWIHHTYPGIPAIVITAWEDDDLRSKAVASGVSGFFYKPFSDETFLHTIHAALANNRDLHDIADDPPPPSDSASNRWN